MRDIRSYRRIGKYTTAKTLDSVVAGAVREGTFHSLARGIVSESWPPTHYEVGFFSGPAHDVANQDVPLSLVGDLTA
jgi:hypothetical protein